VSALGRVDTALTEALAWLNSPAAIANEIARLEAAQHDGDDSEATRALLADWRAVREAQGRLAAIEEAEAVRLVQGRRIARAEPETITTISKV